MENQSLCILLITTGEIEIESTSSSRFISSAKLPWERKVLHSQKQRRGPCEREDSLSAPLCQEYEKRGKTQESKLSNWYLPRVLVIGANAITSLKFSSKILWSLPYQWMQAPDRIRNPASNLNLTYSILDPLKNTDHLHTVVLQRHWTLYLSTENTMWKDWITYHAPLHCWVHAADPPCSPKEGYRQTDKLG